VLNLRTGGVAAVLNRTRDQEQDLGGYAIPAKTLAELDPSLRQANLAFHEENGWWFKALSPETAGDLGRGATGRLGGARSPAGSSS